jgi:hypothetical protein
MHCNRNTRYWSMQSETERDTNRVEVLNASHHTDGHLPSLSLRLWAGVQRGAKSAHLRTHNSQCSTICNIPKYYAIELFNCVPDDLYHRAMWWKICIAESDSTLSIQALFTACHSTAVQGLQTGGNLKQSKKKVKYEWRILYNNDWKMKSDWMTLVMTDHAHQYCVAVTLMLPR